MFEQDNQAVMDDDTYGCGHVVHHGSDLYRETHKDATEKGEIGVSKIQHHHHLEIGVSPQGHQHKSVPSSSTQPEGTSKSSLEGDEIKNYINKCDVNAADKEVGREDNFENEDCSNLQDLEDVNLTAKEDITEVNLKNQESTDVTDVQDEVGGTITDSIQATIDSILFGLSTSSTTKSLDIAASNKMTKRHWYLSDSQIPPDFPDAQIRELQASKAKTPVKRERKKSRILRSSYISMYSSGSKDAHLDVIFYHLTKKSKIQLGENYRYTKTSFFFKTYVEKTHTRYYLTEPEIDLSTQQDYAESIVVANNEDAIANIIQEFYMPAGLPWHMVDEKKKEPPIEIQKLAVMPPTYLSDNDFYDNTERTDCPLLEVYKGKITQQTGLVNKILFDVDYVQNIPQQASDSLNIKRRTTSHLCGFDAASQRACYASLLWHYRVKKTNEGYTSDNGDPPRPRKSVIKEIQANAIVTLEL
ncbi:hypothetical protein BC332_27756 [Capsicum chinense]|nr:hypothetical protein BC332_27756 [Capsicum chinense]